MAGDELTAIKNDSSQDNSGDTSSASRRTGWQIFGDYVRKLFSPTTQAAPSSGGSVRLILTAVAVILIAVALLWIVDKTVSYYVARSYVDQVASVFDLNKHLADALVLITFIAFVFFGRFIWSFSKQRRIVGIVGVSVLLIGHSLILWYGTRGSYFDRAGNATKCYVLTRDGKVTYGEQPGVDPTTGRLCRSVTAEMLERLKEYEAGKRPQQIMATNPNFFDPRTGEPVVWYYKSKDNKITIFDLMGFHPDTGDELIPISKEVVEQWKVQSDRLARRVPKLINPDKYVFFDPLNGDPRAWYWRDANGRYEFYDSPGFQPQTGDKLLVVTRDIVSEWNEKQNNTAPPVKAPNRVEVKANTVFFDPVTGAPRLWYWRRDKGEYEFFDGPGFHPKTGEPLKVFSKESLLQNQTEIEERAKQLKIEQDRIEAEQRAKIEEEKKKQLEQQRKADEEERKRSEELKRTTEAARRCDELAANPNDVHRVGEGISYAALKSVTSDAIAACETAVKQNPDELRFKYQLGRALEQTEGPARGRNRLKAFQIHQDLVSRRGYAAACDNLGSIYIRDKNDLGKAIALFRTGVQLGDSDSMISLADLVDKGLAVPASAQESVMELYKRAAELGNQNAVRAYQEEVMKAENAQQQRVQQLEQQRMMLQFMGTVLQNIPR